MGSGSIGQAIGFVNPATLAMAGVGSLFKANLDDAKGARRAQEELEANRRRELSSQAAAREAAALRAETSGRRAGGRTSFLSNIGFGSGNTTTGLGAGNLVGGTTLFGN